VSFHPAALTASEYHGCANMLFLCQRTSAEKRGQLPKVTFRLEQRPGPGNGFAIVIYFFCDFAIAALCSHSVDVSDALSSAIATYVPTPLFRFASIISVVMSHPGKRARFHAALRCKVDETIGPLSAIASTLSAPSRPPNRTRPRTRFLFPITGTMLQVAQAGAPQPATGLKRSSRGQPAI
jgi:hypothetical protein